jgi:hypothetical protein
MRTPVPLAPEDCRHWGRKRGWREGFQGRITCLAAGRRCGLGFCAASKMCTSGGKSATYPDDVLFYGVVSAQTERVVEFFLERAAAEAMIGEAGGRAGVGGGAAGRGGRTRLEVGE